MTEQLDSATLDLIAALAIAKTALAAIKESAPYSEGAAIAGAALARINRALPASSR